MEYILAVNRFRMAGAMAARRAISADKIIDFLEASFGAFQLKQTSTEWKWDRSQLMNALQSLEQHGLACRDEGSDYQLAPLGQLAGEGGVEVESIIRLVDCLSPLNPAEINDPTLITAVQITVEMDDQLFPLNYRSKNKEPTFWLSELRHQQVPQATLVALQRSVVDEHTKTLRAKKAVACLLYIAGRDMAEIEALLTQFHYQKDAAGAVRSVAGRTCDLLTTVCSVAQIIHPELDLEERRIRLLHRLNIGVPGNGTGLSFLRNNLAPSQRSKPLVSPITAESAISCGSVPCICRCNAKGRPQ